jgi:hypothetical protein
MALFDSAIFDSAIFDTEDLLTTIRNRRRRRSDPDRDYGFVHFTGKQRR